MSFNCIGLTGSTDGHELLSKGSDVIAQLIGLTQDEASTVAKNSLLALVNLSADEEGATAILGAVSQSAALRETLSLIFVFSRTYPSLICA